MTQLSRMLPLLSILAILTSFAYHPSYALSCVPGIVFPETPAIEVPTTAKLNSIFWQKEAYPIECFEDTNEVVQDQAVKLTPLLTPLYGAKAVHGFEVGIRVNGVEYWEPGPAIATGMVIKKNAENNPRSKGNQSLSVTVLLRRTAEDVYAAYDTRGLIVYDLFSLATENGREAPTINISLDQQIKLPQCQIELTQGAQSKVDFGSLKDVDVKGKTPLIDELGRRRVNIGIKKWCKGPLTITGAFASPHTGFYRSDVSEQYLELKNPNGKSILGASGLAAAVEIVGRPGNVSFNGKPTELVKLGMEEMDKQIGLDVKLYKAPYPAPQIGPFHGLFTITIAPG